ncbi:DUF1772 domain-containing protein [Nitratireductor sp. ZSWI3]|uniref:anthrone oxygenase family protein n=1 Tax=Nitratireductor sp. ZSWI3 TaxID=2966359 RepID=UPI00214FF8D4|nr:anthrone oxygenase family protein [Nitratireductor sp. ZSWI3]MCR4265965.1 DUF1772 domain-containing protein [Nitratireductor sp. ZSWI3]
MRQFLMPALLWFSILGSGLLAGVYFAFSAFVMTALGRLDQATGIAAMNAVDAAIVRSLFMPVFLGTTLAAASLAVLGFLWWGEPGATALLAGGVIYVLGMFVVTVAFNVPLNDALAAVEPSSVEAAELWTRYLRDWTIWNHVRTLASMIALAAFVFALCAE